MSNSTAESSESTPNASAQQDNGITIDNSHPYFLHPSDAPGMVLVNTPFDGKGYPGWRRSILISLSAKNKLGFIDETCPAPALDDPTFKLWSRCNDMVTSWLLNSLSKDIASSVLYSRTAKDLWSDLEHRFGQPNGAKLYHLQKELADLVQGSSDIAGYFTKMKRLWDELDTLNANVLCTCVCSCEGKKKMIQFKGDERLIHFLMGLNDTYAPARSNILMLNPLPTVNHAYSLLMQDENQRETHISSQFPGDSSSFMVGKSTISENQLNTQQKIGSGSGFNYHQKAGNTYFKGNTSNKGKKNNQLCNYCKMTNHTIDNCYRLIGFPADFKFTKSKKFQGTVRSNSASSMEEPEGNQSILAASENPNFAQQLSPNQFTQLVHLLKHIQDGKTVGSEVNANSAAGPFIEEPSSFW